MNQYRVLEGLHFEGKQKYSKGQVVTSVQDLITLFPRKFRRVSVPVVVTSPPPVATPLVPVPVALVEAAPPVVEDEWREVPQGSPAPKRRRSHSKGE